MLPSKGEGTSPRMTTELQRPGLDSYQCASSENFPDQVISLEGCARNVDICTVPPKTYCDVSSLVAETTAGSLYIIKEG